jgi:integrase
LAELLIGTGTRIGEALALTWADVDWRSSAIHVRRAIKQGGSIGSTKSDRARRVELGPRLLGILRDLHAIERELSTGADADALVFPGEDGRPRNRTHVSKWAHRETLRRAGLRQTIRLHDLRHSAAASWIAAGLPLIYVQRQLGHSTVATTEGLYGHLAESFVRHAAAQAEAMIWNDVGTRSW